MEDTDCRILKGEDYMNTDTLKRFAAVVPFWGAVFTALWWLYLEHEQEQQIEFERQRELEHIEQLISCMRENEDMWTTLIK